MPWPVWQDCDVPQRSYEPVCLLGGACEIRSSEGRALVTSVVPKSPSVHAPSFDIRAWVAQSRMAQGLPARVSDPSVVAKVVALAARLVDGSPLPRAASS